MGKQRKKTPQRRNRKRRQSREKKLQQLADLEQEYAERNAEVAERQAELAERRAELAELRAQIARLRRALREDLRELPDGIGRPPSAPGTLVRNILDLLDAKPKRVWNTNEMATACGADSLDTVRASLNALVRNGRVRRVARGSFQSVRTKDKR